jgi:uncharacterized protein YjfI (DUF2170 family)
VDKSTPPPGSTTVIRDKTIHIDPGIRCPVLSGGTYDEARRMDPTTDRHWTVHSLKEALDGAEMLNEGELTARVVQGVEPVLLVTMHEYGDLPIFVSTGPVQTVVSVILWPVDEQEDQAGFNVFLLKAQKLVPLSNFGITTVDGRDYYELFGEISAVTTLQTMIIELRALAKNAIDAASDLRETYASSTNRG